MEVITKDNNRQSAAKTLNNVIISLQEQSSTTIPRKGSTSQKMEKVCIKQFNINDKILHNSGIYALYSKSADKVYIGSTINFNNRIKRHKSYLKRNNHHSSKLQRVYNKYGKEDLVVFILEICNKKELAETETKWIDFFNSFQNGFNCTDKCYLKPSFNLTSEQIEKSISSKKSRKPVICMNLNGEYICRYNSVKEASLAVNVQTTNISSCCKGKLNFVKGFIFKYEEDYNPEINYTYVKGLKVFSEEHKQNISKSLRNNPKPKSKKQIELLKKRSSKPIFKRKVFTDEVTKYDSIKECCEKDSLYSKTLKKHIVSKTPLGGFLYWFDKDIV